MGNSATAVMRTMRTLAVGLLACLAGPAAAQQAYPSKPIRFIVPFPPGGTTNIVARIVGQKLSESLGQQVIVDNRPGGNGIIGTEAVARSAPDGYTILLASSPFVIGPSVLPSLPYDTIKDFAPVATVSVAQQVLAAHPSVPANTLRELIRLAKSRPGQLNYVSAASGAPGHLAGEWFSMLAGIKMQYVPYKGGGPAVTDLLGGQVQLAIEPSILLVPYVKSGKLKAIAIIGSSRLAELPQVPTFAESGLPGLEVNNWYGVVAPAGTPRAVIDKLSTEIAKILALPDIKEKLQGQGMAPLVSTPDEVASLIKADISNYAKVAKAANIKADQ